MVNRIDKFSDKFKNGSIKIRHSIKVTILNALVYMKNFITSSPGVISSSKVEERIDEVYSLLKVWVTDSKILSEFKEIATDYVDKYIELKDYKEDMLKEEKTAEEGDKKVINNTSPTPNYTKKLFKDISIVKGDVTFLPIGPCCHYCIVYKVVDNIAYVIPITTTPDIFNGYSISKSRFWRGTAIYALYQFPIEIVIEKFTMPYDNKSELRSIFKSLESTFKSILPKEKKRKL